MSNELVEKVAREIWMEDYPIRRDLADDVWNRTNNNWKLFLPDCDADMTGFASLQNTTTRGEYIKFATAAVNLVLEAAAERADAIKRENAESRDKHEPGIEPGHDDWISYNHGVFTAGEIASAIRALKGESK